MGGSLLATPLYIPNALPVPAQASCPLITVGANQTQTNAQTVKDRAKVRVRERGRKGDRKWEIDRRGRWRVGASLLSVGSCKNCCILSDGGCVVACRAYFSAAWPSAWIIDFHCPKVALSPSLSLTRTDWQLILLSSRIHLSVDSVPHPILSLSLSLSLKQKSVSLFVYPFVCLFVGCVTLFICLSLSSHATYFHLRPAPLWLLAPPCCIYLSPTLLSWHCFFRLSLISLFSFIPICVCYCRWSQSPLRPFVRVPPLPPPFALFLLCNLCFTFPRTAFLLLLIGICFGLVACFDFNPVQTHFVVAMTLCPWSLTRAALTLCRFVQHINILYIVFVYIFNVHNTLSLQGICNANVTFELYVAWP